VSRNEPFAQNAANLLDAAQTAAAQGAVTGFSVLIGGDGAIRMIAESDWPLASLQAHHGARMAFRVGQTADQRIRVEGRDGSRTCLFETAKPSGAARVLLTNSPCYAATTYPRPGETALLLPAAWD